MSNKTKVSVGKELVYVHGESIGRVTRQDDGFLYLSESTHPGLHGLPYRRRKHLKLHIQHLENQLLNSTQESTGGQK